MRSPGPMPQLTDDPAVAPTTLDGSDGTGEVTARWLGRRSIRGLALGSRLKIEGVLGIEQGVRRVVNPTWEFV